jgi:hypothetical protein
MKLATTVPVLVCGILLSAAAGMPAAQEPTTEKEHKLTTCTMTFDLDSWSAFYKTSKGKGTITCDNGESAKVRIAAKGGGLTFGKSDVVGGTGKFSEARGISELFGAYVQSEAHAGAVKSASAQALTKGKVSLVLTGTGRGIDLGFAFGKFTITRVE